MCGLAPASRPNLGWACLPSGPSSKRKRGGAQYWRDVTSQRTKQALAALKAKGVRLGRPLAVPANVEARIMRLRRRGPSYYRIAQLLTRQGVATGHGAPAWRYDTVQGIVERVRRSRRTA
jgi:hypothetical protein